MDVEQLTLSSLVTTITSRKKVSIKIKTSPDPISQSTSDQIDPIKEEELKRLKSGKILTVKGNKLKRREEILHKQNNQHSITTMCKSPRQTRD